MAYPRPGHLFILHRTWDTKPVAVKVRIWVGSFGGCLAWPQGQKNRVQLPPPLPNCVPTSLNVPLAVAAAVPMNSSPLHRVLLL